MHNSVSQIQTDIEQFIGGDLNQEYKFLERLVQKRKFSDNEYFEGLQYLNTKDPAHPRILVVIDLFKLLSPSTIEKTIVIQHLEEAIKQGNLHAMPVVGLCYAYGLNVAKDPVKAVGLFQHAADSGIALAVYNLGICYKNGIGVSKDPIKAVALLQKAADNGIAEATCGLGHCYKNGIGVAKDPVKAVELYQKALNSGSVTAAYSLGDCYENGIGVAKDPVKAVGLFQHALDGGSAAAAYYLGLCYETGTGVAKDPVKAVRLFEQALDGGIAAAGYKLGIHYETGTGVAIDLVKAVEFYQIAVNHGSAAAAHSLGACYQNGMGVAKDPVKAVGLFQRALDGGSSPAAYFLGFCYQTGTGVAEDPVKAVRLFQQAFDGGIAAAAYHLGIHYEDGRGVAIDLLKAVEFYQIAVDNGSAVALHDLKSCLIDTDFPFERVNLTALAKCCAMASKRFTKKEDHSKAKEILSTLAKKTDNFEVQYWATLILGEAPTWSAKLSNIGHLQGPIMGLIRENPNAFVDCLLRDNFHTSEEKQTYFKLALENFSQILSGKSTFLILHQLGELDKWYRTQNPFSYFRLLPKDMLSNFADSLIPKPAEAMKSPQETPVPHP